MTPGPIHGTTDSTAGPFDRIVADVHSWPLFAEPVIHTRTVSATDDVETFELWIRDGTVRPITLERRVSAESTTLVFSTSTNFQSTTVRYRNDDTLATDIEFGVEEVETLAGGDSGGQSSVEAVARQIVAELVASAEVPGGPGAWVYTFEDVVHTQGSFSDVYQFLSQLELWPDRIPHVHELSYDEDDNGVQTVWTTILGDNGVQHRIPSIRICFGLSRVVYKPLTVPPIAKAHVGQWLVEQHADSVTIAGRHTVALDPAGMRKVLGEGVDIETATRKIRASLGKHSLDTLEAAKAFAENRLRLRDLALSWDRLGAS